MYRCTNTRLINASQSIGVKDKKLLYIEAIYQKKMLGTEKNPKADFNEKSIKFVLL
jgi:hypothetical protein